MQKNREYRFESIKNFRDLGGIPAAHDSFIKPNLLYRSGTLSEASDHDLLVLSELGIRTIVDFRSHLFFEDFPDRLPNDYPINTVRLPVANSHIEHLFERLRALRPESGGYHNGSKLMIDIYRSFPIDFTDEARIFIQSVTRQKNLPLICHCSAGKDRTGFFVAVLLMLLGVAENHIVADYQLSGSSQQIPRKESINRYDLPQELTCTITEPRPEYLRAAFQVIDENYGTFDRFVGDGLKIDEAVIKALQSALLTSNRD